MKLHEWLQTFEEEIYWKCTKCEATGSVLRNKTDKPGLTISTIHNLHSSITTDIIRGISRDTCPEPEFEIYTDRQKNTEDTGD